MSRDTEKMFSDLQNYLNSQDFNISDEEDLNEKVQEFMKQYNSSIPDELTEKTAKTSDDFLELSENAENKASALKYAKKALKLDPDNLDAEMRVADLGSKDELDHLRKVEKIVDHGQQLMEQGGFMTEDTIGDFWQTIGTRPYIRCLIGYAHALQENGMIKRAISTYEEVLRLNTDDNMGARYSLMHLYALMEDEESSLALFSRYEGEDTMFLLPLSLLYFKLENLEKSEEYLQRLVKANKDTKRFFRGIVNDSLEDDIAKLSGWGYRPGTIEELLVDIMENQEAFTSSPSYIIWANNILKKRKKKGNTTNT